MTDKHPLFRFREALASACIRQDPVARPRPFDVSPWLAMSILQKAIRRGREDMALRAAATLLETAPDRLWRRLGIIAFEDIGVADLPAVGFTVAGLEGRTFRKMLGGEWRVASKICTVFRRAILTP